MPETVYCNSCGAPVLWVISHKGRRFTVDAKPVETGCFSLDGNLARYLPPVLNLEADNRYQPHKLTCTGKGKKAQTDALKRTLEKARAGL